ncbi:arylsulfatase J-like [Antedon mediterranea]|uniref:arylsulfatase J-like n=1 Tax=Antedon mediterranea TaxID=105859 RepID=UPI003AF8E5BF
MACNVLNPILIFLSFQFSAVVGYKQPNVIFILTDDQGYRDVGYHGALFDTPVIDKLAAEGVKLENYYVQPICSPTRSQLMTGRYQIRTGLQHGVFTDSIPSCLPTDEITLAQKMKEAGYSTHLVGKWHLGYYDEACLPNNRGFDSFLGLYLGFGTHYSHKSLPPLVDGYDFHRNYLPAFEYNGTYSTHVFTDEAIDIIKNKTEDKPLFLYLSYQAPHSPLEVPDEYKEPLRGIFTDENRLSYAAMVSCLDEGIGKVIDALKETGIYEDTIIIFSSDNGGVGGSEGNNWPLRGLKFSLFEGGIRAVGFVHSPLLSVKVKGTINNGLIHVSDWFPTIVEGIAGWNTNGTKPLDGINQWNTIKYGTCSSRLELLHNINPLNVVSGGRDWIVDISLFNVSIEAAIRYRDWKLLTGNTGQTDWIAPPDSGLTTIIGQSSHSDQIVWLYNVRKDPLEMNDLSEAYPTVVKFLLTKLYNYHNQSVPVFFPAPQREQADPCLNGNDCVFDPWEPVP